MSNNSDGDQQRTLGDPTPNLKWRKTKGKEDSRKAALRLKETRSISPYSVDQLTSLIRAAAKTGELELQKAGRTTEITNLWDWFDDRVQPNTVSLTRENYFTALANSFELLTIGEPARTDFGSSRQREFGQQWTDFTRGYLGEIAVKRFFDERFNTEVALRQRDSAAGVEEYLPTDVTEVRDESGEWRQSGNTLSVKTSKLSSMWLPIPSNQISHSSAFTFAKIGIPLDHLSIFLKETDALDRLLTHINHDDAQEVLSTIPDFEPIPAYLPGFAWQEDYRNGELQKNQAKKWIHITGGIGKRPENTPAGYEGYNIVGLGDPNEEYLAATGALRWESDEWAEFMNAL